ncbi:MAG: hypothetical protein HFE64_06125 [Lachnospiraceae bacterium]|nr:hypothetical protein [Lachnospiraceae bacterium]
MVGSLGVVGVAGTVGSVGATGVVGVVGPPGFSGTSGWFSTHVAVKIRLPCSSAVCTHPSNVKPSRAGAAG